MITSSKEVILAEKAPKPIGPYSVAIRFDHLIFTAGQLGIDRATGDLVPGGIEAETRQALMNIQNVLEASGSNMDMVLKTTVFMRDLGEFSRMNAIYGEFFTQKAPARSTVQVAALPKGGAVEIEAIAVISPPQGI
jgi:2-iminobutanoate/2-iminopropanoate deaminase